MSVNLTKGQRVSLTKGQGESLTRVKMGLGWDAVKKKGFFGGKKSQTIDLDASCLLFDGSRQRSSTRSGSTSCAARTGPSSTPATTSPVTATATTSRSSSTSTGSRPTSPTLVFTVNSFTGQDFSQIENAFCRARRRDDGAGDRALRAHRVGHPHAQIMAKVARDGAGWAMTAIGEPASGRTFKDLLPAIGRHL